MKTVIAFVAIALFVASATPSLGLKQNFDPKLAAAGKKAYMANQCQSCHGDKGDANTPVAKALPNKPRNFVTEKLTYGNTVKKIAAFIKKGNTAKGMAPYAHVKEADRVNMAHFLLSLRKK
jgi:mono/diheme cytochrome c family protein